MRYLSLNLIPALLGLILFAVLLTAGEQVRRWIVTSGPAIEWQGVEVMTQTVRPGGQLEMIYTAIVHRACPADLRSFIVSQDGSVPVRYPVVAGGYSKPSDDPVQIRVAVTIPRTSDAGLARLKSGPHVYRTMATRYCPDGVEEDTAVPDAPFMMEVE